MPLAPFRPGIDTQPAIVALPAPEPYPGADYRKPILWKIEADRTRRHRGVCRMAGARERLDGERAWRLKQRVFRFSRVTSACCSGGSEALRRMSLGLTFGLSKLDGFRICWLAGAGFTRARKSKRYETRFRRSSGRTTSLRCSRRLRGPLFALTDAQLLAYRAAHSDLYPFRKPAGRLTRKHRGSCRRARRVARSCIEDAIDGRSPTRSGSCLRRRARTRGLRTGAPASRRLRT